MSYNKQARDKLEILYGCRDMLTLVSPKNKSFHHLEKYENGGKATVLNGAILERITHDWLHTIELVDYELYELINECIKLYKYCLDVNNTRLIKQYDREIVPIVQDLVEEFDNERKVQKSLLKRTS